MEGDCFWVNLREDNKVSESKMAVSESNMAEFKMAAIIKLSQNERVNFFVQDGWIQDSRIQDDCHHQVECECMSEVFLCKMAKSMMAKFKMAAIIKLSENEWVKFFLCKMAKSMMADFKMVAIMKLSENAWVKFFCGKAESKMADFKMAAIIKLSQNEQVNFFVQIGWIQDSRIQDGCHHQFEWECMREVFFVEMAESKMAEFEMAAIIKLVRLN